MPGRGFQGSFIGTNNQEKAKRLTGEHPQTATNYVEVMASRSVGTELIENYAGYGLTIDRN